MKNWKSEYILDVIMNNLLDYDIFDKNNPKYHWTYDLIERKLKKRFCKMQNFYFVELKKFVNQINKNNNEFNKVDYENFFFI